jgi:sugar phosphate permease
MTQTRVRQSPLGRYRWLVLAAGTAAQTSFSAVIIGLPVLAPALRDAHSLSLLQIGVVLDSLWIGTLLTLLPWGVLADRIGERLVLASGLVACGAALVGAGSASGFGMLIVLIGLAGAAGASVNAASGRAVMQWFPAAERGFALGVRQTAIPVGGLISALVLPALSLSAAFVFLAALCVAGAVFGLAAIRERQGLAEEDVLEPRGLGATLRDHRLWLLCAGSSLYLVAQLAITGFLVLFLHDERGLSDGAAAGVLAGVQVVAAALRIGGGRWSDRLGSRLRPLRVVGIGSALTLAVAVALLSAPLAVLVAAFVLAGGLSMAWNGLSCTAAAEIAGRSRSGAALGMQQTALAAAGAVVPPAFAAVVAASSWRVGFALAAVFPLAGVQLLRPLRA